MRNEAVAHQTGKKNTAKERCDKVYKSMNGSKKVN